MRSTRPNVLNLPGIIVFLALIPCSALAQQSDVEAIKSAHTSFFAAVGSLDMKEMEPLWAHESYVTLINPDSKSVSVGWDAVKKNWEDGTFKNFAELKLTPVDAPQIHVNGNVGWSTGLTRAEGKTRNGHSVNANVFGTQIYEKQGGRWLLVSDTALPMPNASPAPNTH